MFMPRPNLFLNGPEYGPSPVYDLWITVENLYNYEHCQVSSKFLDSFQMFTL